MVTRHINSIFNSVSYKIGDILIDPGDEWEGFQNVGIVLLTHAHFDHIYGLNRVIELNPNAIVITNEYGALMLTDDKLNLSRFEGKSFVFNHLKNIRIVSDDDILNVYNEQIRIYETPGHNPSCITYVVGENVFTGDAYIPGLKTVTNFPKGNKEMAEESVKRIINISTNKIIYPGHHIK